MAKQVEEETYINTSEAVALLGSSRQIFYSNVKGRLHAYHFDGKKANWWKERDVLAVKNGKLVRKGAIGISGLLENWSAFLATLGYEVQTVDRSVEVTTLPEDAIATFRLQVGQRFVKRSRMTLADGQVICTWDTFYPYPFVSDILDEMKQGTAHGIVDHMKDVHGIVIGKAKDKYAARITSPEEQNLFQLPTDEAILMLQRVSYTRDRKTLVMYQDMALLGNWFAPEHEYDVKIWGE